jgi:hypothetical protein
MNHLFFITGFNNWGKSSIIRSLFSPIRRFWWNGHYPLHYHPHLFFSVKQASNDDYPINDYLQSLNDHVQAARQKNIENMIAALCPSLEANNNFHQILQDPVVLSFKQVHLVYLEYRWEGHAKLLISQIRNSISQGVLNLGPEIIIADQAQMTNQQLWDRKIRKISDDIAQMI